MKHLLRGLLLGLILSLGSHAALAQSKKPATPSAPAVEPAKPAAAKSIPMYVRVDEIDAKGRKFTQITKDGRRVRHTLTAATEIMNGDKAAKLEDIKVGEYVSGLRRKTAENEYEVVKITKFGPKADKPAASPASKPAPKPAK
jgi:hypothetical protein